jgi:hypothetical protein
VYLHLQYMRLNHPFKGHKPAVNNNVTSSVALSDGTAWIVNTNMYNKQKNIMFRAVFWVILPCKMIVDRRFRGAYCLHHQGWVSRAPRLASWTTDTYINLDPSVARLTHPWWWRQYAPLKSRSTIILHGSITQKTALNTRKKVQIDSA